MPYQENLLQAEAAPAREVETRLDANDVAFLERCRIVLDEEGSLLCEERLSSS